MSFCDSSDCYQIKAAEAVSSPLMPQQWIVNSPQIQSHKKNKIEHFTYGEINLAQKRVTFLNEDSSFKVLSWK